MLKFIFLGLNGSLQEADSGNTSLLISGEKGCVTVDLSCNLARIVNANIDAVILTHEHIDHIYALPSLLHQLWISGRTRALDIYIPEGMISLVNNLINLFEIREKRNMFEIRICTQTVFSIGTMKITLFPTDHTNISVGMVIEDGIDKLVYTADTRPIKEILPCMRDAQILIHEAAGVSENQEELLLGGHSSGADAGRMARALNVEKLYLCHLPKGRLKKAEILKEASAYYDETVIPRVLEELMFNKEIL